MNAKSPLTLSETKGRKMSKPQENPNTQPEDRLVESEALMKIISLLTPFDDEARQRLMESAYCFFGHAPK